MKTDNQKISDYKNITTFQGLNSLRFIAAFFVVMHHSETIKRKNGIENFEWLGLFRNGGNAVTFFFVLSGFLITYKLLRERDKSGTIRIKKFYLKRILRIWPLYFLLVFIGTIVLPFAFSILNVDYQMPYTLGQTWFYFLFFLPGLVTFFFGHHFLEPLWSIGIEEVFYLLWAPLLKFSKNKILILMMSIILVKISLNILGYLVVQNEIFNYIINTFKFEAMAIGGLGAYYIYTRGESITQISFFKIPFQIIIILTIISYLIFHSNIDNIYWNAVFKTPILSSLIVDCLFLHVIICVSIVNNGVIKLNGKTLSFLGEISYGIYMYHMLIIFGAMFFLKKYLIQMSFPYSQVVYYSVITVFIIIVSALSKYLFENYFLNLKRRIDNNANR
jgi:peptidoglycan/LPS O-acetylase OafA/YrhL